jgi:hypothetical protein
MWASFLPKTFSVPTSTLTGSRAVAPERTHSEARTVAKG